MAIPPYRLAGRIAAGNDHCSAAAAELSAKYQSSLHGELYPIESHQSSRGQRGPWGREAPPSRRPTTSNRSFGSKTANRGERGSAPQERIGPKPDTISIRAERRQSTEKVLTIVLSVIEGVRRGPPMGASVTLAAPPQPQGISIVGRRASPCGGRRIAGAPIRCLRRTRRCGSRLGQPMMAPAYLSVLPKLTKFSC